jgi:CBS domain-containing protein
MKVRDIMTSEGLATANLDTTLAEIAERMRDENVGAIPIVDDDDKLTGIITDRDIVVRAIAEGEDPNECTAEEILSEQLHTIHPDADLEQAADLMASRQIRRLPVLEDDVIIGMISLGDLAVKSEEDEASDALEDISEGVRTDGKTHQQVSGRQRQGQQR